MVPTGYIRTVREALAGYRQGEYARSEELWNEVLASNPHFTVAYRSIGRALLADGDCPGGDGIPAGGRRPVLLFARPAGIPPGFHPEQPTLAAARHARRPGGAGCGLAPLETMAAILMSHERRGSHVQPVQIPAAEL